MLLLLSVVMGLVTKSKAFPGRASPVSLALPKGIIQGSSEKMYELHGSPIVYKFLGVPFAKPPLGKLRYKEPVEVRSWNGTKDTTQLPAACYQESDTAFGEFWGSTMWNANTKLSEDCLYLNIWTPKIDHESVLYKKEDNGLLPVLVWLFGGGFYYGSASLNLYNGRVLAAEGKVVVVNVNYRVGIFGFLYLDHPDIPGNVGLKDQQMALQWIQENIRHFGGDPNKVTIFGESAGGAAAVAHLIQKDSWPLFDRMILQSGTLDNPWALDSAPKAIQKSWLFVQSTKCSDSAIPEMNQETLDCLLTKTAAELSANTWTFTSFSPLEFPLVISSKDRSGFFGEQDALVTLRKGKTKPDTPVIIGVNKDEGHFWLLYYLSDFFKRHTTAPPKLEADDFEASVNSIMTKLSPLHRKALIHTYWDKSCSQNPTFYAEQLNQMVGDFFFTCDSLWLGDSLVSQNAGPVYVYYLTQVSSANPWPRWMGVMHGYEIEYIFGVPLINRTANYSPQEKRLSHDMIQLWSSFAGQKPLSVGGKIWHPLGNTTKEWLELNGHGHSLIPAIKTEECQVIRQIRDRQFSQYTNFSPKTRTSSLHSAVSSFALVILCFVI